MTFLGAPLSLVAPALAAGAAALIGLYLLKQRRRRLEVPFADLWRRVLSESQATALWRKLRRLVSLAIQLLVLTLLLVAVTDPHLSASRRGRSLVLLVDTSASMQATDGDGRGRSRLEVARDEARRVVRGLGGEDNAMVLALDGRPAPVSGFQSDDRELERELDGLRATDTAADLDRALRLAADALNGRPRPTIVLIGDGAWDPAVLGRIRLDQAPRADEIGAIDLHGVDLRYLPIGRSGDNAGITAFSVRRYQANQTAYEVLVEVQSFRAAPAPAEQLTLQLVQDGEVVEATQLTLKPGERVERVYPNLAGEGTRLEARLSERRDVVPGGARPAAARAHDLLAVDDVAYALLPPRKKQKVLLVTAGNLFLEGALLLDENLAVDKIAPAAWDANKSAGYDAVVLDRFTPAEAPRAHALYVDPQGASSPFAIAGAVDGPIVTEVAAEHPLLRWVALKDLNIARASRFRLGAGEVAVASSFHAPILAARVRGGRKTVAFGFALERSDLPLRVAFPILTINALDWFAGRDGGLTASYATGRTVRLPVAGDPSEVEIRGPDGGVTRAPVHDGRAAWFGTRVGYYELRTTPGQGATASTWLAANLASPSESRIAPVTRLVVNGRELGPPDAGRLGVRRALWSYLVLAALLLVMAEWWTFHRRVTV